MPQPDERPQTLPPSRWARLSPLLDELLDTPDALRPATLLRLCQTHADLADELQALALSAQQAALGRFLTGTGAELPAEAGTLAGQRLGAYTLEEPLGQGGTGSVWRARRDDGRFTGQVAIKLLHLSLLGRAGAERFQREGQVLARLTHPHIARLLDAGVAPGGQPYLVIELVQGQRIDQHCQQRRLSVAARLALFAEVLSAVAHAHSHLVIHRDIKPANVLVGDDGQVKLLDFGIAKLLESDTQAAEATALTREAGRVLTPEFAAPEQLQGQAITTATDVHGLGLLLYQLLSGQMPPRRQAGHELPPPSRAMQDASERRQVEGDLDTIVQRALKTDAAERYATVSAMAEDLERFRDGRPVLAQRDSAAYRARKWVARNKAATAVAAATLLALVGGAHAQVAVLLALATGALLALWQLQAARAQAVRAIEAQRRAEEVKQFISSIFSESRPREGSGGVVTAIDLLQSARLRIEAELSGNAPMAAELGVLVAASCENLGHVAAAREALNAALPRCLQAFGPRHALSLRARCLDVGVAHAESNTVYTEPLMPALIADLRQAQPPQHRLLAEALREQSYLLAKLNLEEPSLASVREAVELARSQLGPTDEESMAALGLLANTYQHFKRMDEAVAATEALMQVTRQAYGAQRPHTILCENERLHAYSLTLVCRPAEAEPLARQVMADRILLDVETTQAVMLTQSLLAMCLGGQGRYAEAIALAEGVLAQQRRLYADGNWDTAAFAWRLAGYFLASRRHAETVAALDEEDRFWARHPGEPPDLKMRRLHARALLAAWQGDFDSAEALAQTILDDAARRRPTDRAQALHILATVARLRGDDNAVEQARHALDAPVPPYQMLQLARNQTEQGLAWLDAGQLAEAEAMLDQAQATFDRAQVLPQTLLRCDAAIGQARLMLHRQDDTGAALTLRWVEQAWRTLNPDSIWHAQAQWLLMKAEHSGDTAATRRLRHVLASSPLPVMRRLVNP